MHTGLYNNIIMWHVLIGANDDVNIQPFFKPFSPLWSNINVRMPKHCSVHVFVLCANVYDRTAYKGH